LGNTTPGTLENAILPDVQRESALKEISIFNYESNARSKADKEEEGDKFDEKLITPITINQGLEESGVINRTPGRVIKINTQLCENLQFQKRSSMFQTMNVLNRGLQTSAVASSNFNILREERNKRAQFLDEFKVLSKEMQSIVYARMKEIMLMDNNKKNVFNTEEDTEIDSLNETPDKKIEICDFAA